VDVNGDKKFAPEHTRGDILILADFSGCGNNATVKVYRWIGRRGPTSESSVFPNTDGNLETKAIGSIVAQNNVTGEPIPVGWNFLTKRVPKEYE